jgi:hypothetical protein
VIEDIVVGLIPRGFAWLVTKFHFVVVLLWVAGAVAATGASRV